MRAFRVVHIPLAEIDDVDVTEVTPAQAGGLGWRIVGSEQFVLWSAGPAVRLRLISGASRVIRTDRADELSDAITTQQACAR